MGWLSDVVARIVDSLIGRAFKAFQEWKLKQRVQKAENAARAMRQQLIQERIDRSLAEVEVKPSETVEEARTAWEEGP